MPACDVWEGEEGVRGPIGIAGVAGGPAGVGVDNRVVSVKGERPEAGGQLLTEGRLTGLVVRPCLFEDGRERRPRRILIEV